MDGAAGKDGARRGRAAAPATYSHRTDKDVKISRSLDRVVSAYLNIIIITVIKCQVYHYIGYFKAHRLKSETLQHLRVNKNTKCSNCSVLAVNMHHSRMWSVLN